MTSHSTLLAFDFDGTLAPICQDPEAVRLPSAATALLTEATSLRGVIVAVVSGRDAGDLASRTNIPGAYLIGSHGLEIRGPGGVVVRDEPPLCIEVESDLRAGIEASGLRLETKKHAITLHWRGLHSDAIAPMADRFRVWARSAGLDVIEGRCIVEARRRGTSKEEALRWLCSALGVSRVIYAGDDIPDFAALRFANEKGRGIFIASAELEPPPGVTIVDSFRDLFRLIREEVMM